MTTEAQILANRRNALKSTGPRTPQSKAATAQNAAKLVFFSHQPEKTDYKQSRTKKELRKNNLFFQNKPNLPNARINVSKVLTKDYGNARLHGHPENKPKTNPIQTQFTKCPKLT